MDWEKYKNKWWKHWKQNIEEKFMWIKLIKKLIKFIKCKTYEFYCFCRVLG